MSKKIINKRLRPKVCNNITNSLKFKSTHYLKCMYGYFKVVFVRFALGFVMTAQILYSIFFLWVTRAMNCSVFVSVFTFAFGHYAFELLLLFAFDRNYEFIVPIYSTTNGSQKEE